MTSLALLALTCLALSGCATSGSWFLLIARDGTCRQTVHEAKTGQLDTKTTWRGEQCPPKQVSEE